MVIEKEIQAGEIAVIGSTPNEVLKFAKDRTESRHWKKLRTELQPIRQGYTVKLEGAFTGKVYYLAVSTSYFILKKDFNVLSYRNSKG